VGIDVERTAGTPDGATRTDPLVATGWAEFDPDDGPNP
jgi:hypothetical protein